MHQPVQRKIVSPMSLADVAQKLRSAGRRLVHCHGCFDIVHPGHVRYLQYARQLGDVLIVSLTGDAAVNKGPGRPYIPQELRAENLAALEFVDWVVIDPHATACELLALVKPDVYVKGAEYASSSDPRFLREREIVERYGGRVAFHSGDVVLSSTRLLAGLRTDSQLEEQRLSVFCRRNAIDAAVVTRTVASYEGQRVVVIGDLLRERYVLCEAGEPAEDAPVLTARRLGVAEYWGGAAAVAFQLRALGAVPTLIASIGSDAASEECAAALQRSGLTHHLLRERPNAITRETVVADGQKVLKLIDGPSTPLDSAAERRAAELADGALQDARVLVWCDHGFGMVTPGLHARVQQAAQEREMFVAGMAPGERGQVLSLAGTQLLVASERLARAALHDRASALPAVVWHLLNRTGGRVAIVGLRSRGLMSFDGREAGPGLHAPAGGFRPAGPLEPWRDRLRTEFVPALSPHNIDGLGTDEAVLAAAALALASGAGLPLATYLAAAAEALAGSAPGANPPDAGDLLAWFAHRTELLPDSRFVALPDSGTQPAEHAACACPD